MNPEGALAPSKIAVKLGRCLTPPVSAPVCLADGHELNFSVSLSPPLLRGTSAQRGNIELLPYTLHWLELDEDITIESIANAAKL